MTVLDLITKLTEMARDNPEAKVTVDVTLDSSPAHGPVEFTDLCVGLICWANNKTKQSIIIEINE